MTLHYCLLVLAAPASGHTSLTAARFAAALLARGHTLSRVFFLDNGTSNGLATAITPQDERSPQQAWSALADANSAEAQRHGFPAATVHPGFTLGGLGLLVEAMQSADRVVTFGAPA